MNAASRELAWQNARILSLLPIEQWLEDLFAYHESWSMREHELSKLLRAMLEVKRTVEGMDDAR